MDIKFSGESNNGFSLVTVYLDDDLGENLPMRVKYASYPYRQWFNLRNSPCAAMQTSFILPNKLRGSRTATGAAPPPIPSTNPITSETRRSVSPQSQHSTTPTGSMPKHHGFCEDRSRHHPTIGRRRTKDATVPQTYQLLVV